MTKLNDSEISVLKHTLGLDRQNPTYRNYFIAGKKHRDYPTLEGLVRKGLMVRTNNHLDEVSVSYLYYTNLRGKEALKLSLEEK